MPDEKHFLRSIRLRNVLSFGPDTEELTLGPLNVLIGPNGSGKSNLIDAIGLLRAAPRDLFAPVRAHGGIGEWIWKGASSEDVSEISVTTTQPWRAPALRHRISFGAVGQRAELLDEAIENDASRDERVNDAYFYYRYQQGRPLIRVRFGENSDPPRAIKEELLPGQSILSQRQDSDLYPDITYLARTYASTQFYFDGDLGRTGAARRPQATDAWGGVLASDASNLALVLNDLEHRANLRSEIAKRLRDADGSVVDFSSRVSGGTIQLYLHYANLANPVSASRLSDGTFRYLCMLAVLCHPEPPPLVCLEEPETGLHPDLLPRLAELLIDASERMQLIVTTHSDVLVDALSERPECVVVCEKVEGVTRMRRLDREALGVWLAEYGLGQLWREGHIGGNRW